MKNFGSISKSLGKKRSVAYCTLVFLGVLKKRFSSEESATGEVTAMAVPRAPLGTAPIIVNPYPRKVLSCWHVISVLMTVASSLFACYLVSISPIHINGGCSINLDRVIISKAILPLAIYACVFHSLLCCQSNYNYISFWIQGKYYKTEPCGKCMHKI